MALLEVAALLGVWAARTLTLWAATPVQRRGDAVCVAASTAYPAAPTCQRKRRGLCAVGATWPMRAALGGRGVWAAASGSWIGSAGRAFGRVGRSTWVVKRSGKSARAAGRSDDPVWRSGRAFGCRPNLLAELGLTLSTVLRSIKLTLIRRVAKTPYETPHRRSNLYRSFSPCALTGTLSRWGLALVCGGIEPRF